MKHLMRPAIALVVASTLVLPGLATANTPAKTQAGSLVVYGVWKNWPSTGVFFIKATVDKHGKISNPNIYYNKPDTGIFRGTLTYLSISKTRADFYGTGTLEIGGKKIDAYMKGNAEPTNNPTKAPQVKANIVPLGADKHHIHESGDFLGQVLITIL